MHPDDFNLVCRRLQEIEDHLVAIRQSAYTLSEFVKGVVFAGWVMAVGYGILFLLRWNW